MQKLGIFAAVWSSAMLLVVAGPTASGKSALSIEIAKQVNGQIVSADSMQIYRGMDIGTAKVPETQRVVKHYGIDILNPDETYSVALFQEYARSCFTKIKDDGHVPILCGGTGFYIRAAIDDYKFPKGDQLNNDVRQYYQKQLEVLGKQGLWEVLKSKDPDSAAVIHPNNSKRVVRALELYEVGESYARQVSNLKSIKQAIPAIMILIEVDKEILNKRINARVDKMRDEGLVDEVKRLLNLGFRKSLTSPAAIGYKEIVSALDGEISMDEAFEQIKMATRRYAKRQRSWFRADKRYHAINADHGNTKKMLDDALKIIDTFKEAK